MGKLSEFYSGKTVFLTGGTGLVGKVLVEAMLRQLSDIEKIYVLIRPKPRPGGVTVTSEDRLRQEVQGSAAFDLPRSEQRENLSDLFQSKVKAVEGDLALEKMGLDDDTYRTLQREVNILINCAAIVSFDAAIDNALALNALGPRRLLEFARGCEDVGVAQVSTCYVNAARTGSIYEEPLDPRWTVGQASGVDKRPYEVDEEIAAIAKRAREIREASGEAKTKADTELIDGKVSEFGMKCAQSRGWHDVYTFTKAMGEQIFGKDLGTTRGAIIRPAIIESVWRFPLPGWLNGYRMLDPLIVAYGRGRLIDFPGNGSSILDIIPVDLVVNSILAIAREVYQGRSKPVYQIASGMENPLTLQGFADLVDEYFQENPFESQTNGQGRGRELKKPTFPNTQTFLRRLKRRYYLPAKVAKALVTPLSFTHWGRAKKVDLRTKLSALERLHQYGRLYGPYAESNCEFQTVNTREAWRALDAEDRESFNFDISQLDWPTYIKRVHVPGVKKYLLGMTDEPPNEAELEAALEAHGPTSPLPQSLMGNLPTFEELEPWLRPNIVRSTIRKMGSAVVFIGFNLWVRHHSKGLENVPDKGPFIVASNHSSHLDAPAILFALSKRPFEIHPTAAKDYFFGDKLKAILVRSVFRAIPFERRGPATDGLHLPLGILKMGRPMVFFPEGGRSKSGKILTFKNGIGMLGLMSGAPVVPARISGSYQSMPKGSRFPKRGRVTVRFGPPILTEPYRVRIDATSIAEVCRELSSDVQKAVEALNGKR